MFKFIRRVSTSLLPRPDRPWRDDGKSCFTFSQHAIPLSYLVDTFLPVSGIYLSRYAATSNAPTIGRKRRFSFTEEDDSAPTCVKKARAESAQAEVNTLSTLEVPEQKEGGDVKSVTQGVKDVELEDKVDLAASPEGVPLPDSPGGTPPPDMKLVEGEEEEPAPEEEAEQKGTEDDPDADSVASSSGEGREVCEQGQPEDEPNNDTTATPMPAAPPLEDAPTVDGIHSDDTPTSTETDV